MTEGFERAVGIIPLYTEPDGESSFCLVRHAAGHWGFPKGHLNRGESARDAALRELQEETGITDVLVAPNKTFVETYSFDREGTVYKKTVEYYLGLVDSKEGHTPEAFKKEIPDMRWFNYEEAEGALTFDESKSILRQVHEYLESGV